MPRIVYSRHYNIGLAGLQRLHPFDTRKYGRAYRMLRQHFGRRLKPITLRPPGPAAREDLLRVHTPAYLDRLRDPRTIAAAVELSVLQRLPAFLLDRFLLRPMRWATHGTILGVEQALRHGLAINLGGGFHHAKPSAGEGFCIYADAAVAVQHARSAGWIDEPSRIAYIDLDAHQGNGVCHCFRDDSRVFVFDMYNADIYPYGDRVARERIDCDLPLSMRCGDTEYIDLLRDRLPGFLDSIAHSHPIALAIYNAGTDIVVGDPLGQLNVTPAGVLQRDAFVVNTLRERGIPTLMLPSGGYTSQSYRLIAESVIAQLTPRLVDGRRGGENGNED
jgi:histone deacetylase 11